MLYLSRVRILNAYAHLSPMECCVYVINHICGIEENCEAVLDKFSPR